MRPITLKELTSEQGAIALRKDFQDHTDPKYVGPGTWNVIHRLAINAVTPELQSCFIKSMNDICNGFPCHICKGHCQEYIKNHPMETYLGISVDVDGKKKPLGIFIWTWRFHNAVNTRLQKPIMSWETVYTLYTEGESILCSKNCLEAENYNSNNPNNLDNLENQNNSRPAPNGKINGYPSMNQVSAHSTVPTLKPLASVNKGKYPRVIGRKQ